MAMRLYTGELGIFQYDDTMFCVKSGDSNTMPAEYLAYIGSEKDGLKISVPYGIKSAAYMFASSDLKSPVVFPDTVEICDFAYDGCSKLKKGSVLPFNVKSVCNMYRGCSLLSEPSDLPDSVVVADYMYRDCISLHRAGVSSLSLESYEGMYMGCTKEVRKQGLWQCEHPGLSYVERALPVCKKYYSDEAFRRIAQAGSHSMDVVVLSACAVKQYESSHSMMFKSICDRVEAGQLLDEKLLSSDLLAAVKSWRELSSAKGASDLASYKCHKEQAEQEAKDASEEPARPKKRKFSMKSVKNFAPKAEAKPEEKHAEDEESAVKTVDEEFA